MAEQTPISGVQIVGTDAAPIALGAAGGATDVWTWNHTLQVGRAEQLRVVTATNRALVPDATVTVTQPSTTQIVLTNTAMPAINVLLVVEWSTRSQDLAAGLAATVGTLS